MAVNKPASARSTAPASKPKATIRSSPRQLGEERALDRPIGQPDDTDRPLQLDEGKPGRDPGNELSANTDPTGKTGKEKR